MQIFRNVYVLDGPCYLHMAHVFAIATPEGIVLIDAGTTGVSNSTVLDRMNYWGLDPNKVTHVLLTHAHWDHVGMAAYFQRLGAKVYIHEADAPALILGGPHPDNPFDHQQFEACDPDVTFAEDCTLHINGLEINVICVPGHSPGSVVYEIQIDGKLVWFVGDFFIPDSYPNHKTDLWWIGDLKFDPEALIASCKKTWRMHPDAVLAGHGYLILDNAQLLPRENYKKVSLILTNRNLPT